MPSQQKRLQCGVSSTLDSSRWIKLAKGLDDFRYGPPSPYAGRILPASPAIIHEIFDTPSITPEYSPSCGSVSPSKDLSSTVGTSKVSLSVPTGEHSTSARTQTLAKQMHSRVKQKKRVQSIEQKLKENPLILFPYLESDIPHEVFEKLMSILGATPESESRESLTSLQSGTDLKMSEEKIKLMQSRKLFSRKNVGKKAESRGTASAQAVEEAARHIVKGDATIDTLPRLLTEEFRKMNEERAESTGSVLHQRRPATLDPYRSFLKRINYSGERTKKKVKKADVKPTEESETNVRQVAEDFCNWMQTIGGEDAKFTMDVDKVLTLFAMNAELESLQATSNVLDEFPLSQDEADSLKKFKPSLTSKLSAKPAPVSKVDSEKEASGAKKFQEYRYGAWYLDINQWKKLKPGEILEDPEEVATRERQEANRCSDELDNQLADLHTYHAFTTFIRRNNLKLPSFLQYVAPPVSLENIYDMSDNGVPKPKMMKKRKKNCGSKKVTTPKIKQFSRRWIF